MKVSRRASRGPQSHLERLDRATVGKLEQITAATTRAASLTVARHATNPGDLAELLAMLGLLPEQQRQETA